MPRRRKSPAKSRADRRRIALSVMREVRPVEQRYSSALRGVMQAVAREYMRKLLPRLGEIARKDASINLLSSVFDLVGAEVQAAIPRTVGPLFDQMSSGVRRANARGQALHGIQVGEIRGATGLITNTDVGIQDDIRAARERNILLVENAHRVYAKQVREIVEDPATLGMRVKAIKERLIERGDVSQSRAELIARDQTLKLNGQITATRQMRAGVESYVWSTSQDERVREEHAALEGQTFSWVAPPEVGHPGQDFQCRCVAIPVVQELDAVFK
jgi:SPP1 gp7 family putative phage head morphogenesis protein